MTINKDSIQCVPSPPKSNRSEIQIIKVVSPPPPITPLEVTLVREQEVQQVSPINERENEPLPPPPPEFDNDLGDRSNNFDSCSTSINTKQSVELPDSNRKNDDEIFKKPMLPPPKKKGRKQNTRKFPLHELVQTTIRDNQQLDKSADEADSTLRRSKRGQVPLENPCPLIKMIMEKNLEKQRVEKNQKNKRKHLQKAKAKSDEINTSKSPVKLKRTRNKKSPLPAIPENEQLVVPLYQNGKTPKKKSTNKNNAKVRRKHDNKKLSNISANEAFERSHLTLTNPPPLDHLNNVFEQLRNLSSSLNLSSQSSSQPTTNQSNQPIPYKIKPLKVRIARLKSFTQNKSTETAEVSETNNAHNERDCRQKSPSPAYSAQSQVSSLAANNDSNYELILWLKNISECNTITARNDTIFKEMRISAAANLSFTELQGVEYAFYDTDQKASLGYLRFKPRQIKPKKRAKLFHLHFITLVGTFRIRANSEESILNVGDMVAVDKFVYYCIENITDNIGILMVIKK